MLTKQELINTLNSWGVDTTKATYELFAEEYGRYGEGGTYKVVFTAPGDWVAYLSMQLHDEMEAESVLEFLEEYWGVETIDDIEEIPEEVRTEKGMKDYATSQWWGDGDDYIIYLKNLSNGKVIYANTYNGPSECECEDDWD